MADGFSYIRRSTTSTWTLHGTRTTPARSAGPASTTSLNGAPRAATSTLPPRTAYLLAFLSVVVAGIFGGIIGYGLVDVGCTGSCQGAKLAGTIAGAMIAAGGVGVVAVLVLRAMAEWKRRQ